MYRPHYSQGCTLVSVALPQTAFEVRSSGVALPKTKSQLPLHMSCMHMARFALVDAHTLGHTKAAVRFKVGQDFSSTCEQFGGTE